MTTTGFTPADHKWKFLTVDRLNNGAVVKGVLVDVNCAPEAGIFFINGNNSHSLLTVKVFLKGSQCALGADHTGFSFGLSVRLLSREVVGAIGGFQPTEKQRETPD